MRDIKEELVIVALFLLGAGAMWALQADAKDILVAVTSGLIGYLKGSGSTQTQGVQQ